MTSQFPSLAPGALKGVRVVDFTWFVVGPWASRFLAHFGAEVIKVERPDAWERSRRSVATVTGKVSPNQSGSFNDFNADKLGITLNVRHPTGLELAERLISKSDVVVENFSAGVMESWGLGWDRLRELNPKLVYVSISGFGHSGELKLWKAFGPTAQAISGLTLASGLPGQVSAGWGFSFMDVMGGFLSSVALSMGLYRSRQTGKGMYIDICTAEAAMTLLGPYFLDFEVNGRRTRRPGFPPGNRRLFPPTAPHNTYRCLGKDRVGQDQWVFIACETQAQFDALCSLMGKLELATDPRFVTNAARVQNQDALDEIIGVWTLPRSRYEIMESCQKAGIVAGVVQNGEDRVENDPQLRHRGVFPVLDHPEMGERKYDGYPVKLSRTPARLRRGGPLWKENNNYVFGELLGLSKEEIDKLAADDVI